MDAMENLVVATVLIVILRYVFPWTHPQMLNGISR